MRGLAVRHPDVQVAFILLGGQPGHLDVIIAFILLGRQPREIGDGSTDVSRGCIIIVCHGLKCIGQMTRPLRK